MANKAQMGGIGGAAAGAIAGQAIGKNTEATMIGAAIGGMLGYIIGNEMDKYDLLAIRNTLEYNITNEPSIWASRNPRIQTIQAVPTRTYGHCRDMTLNIKKSDNTFVTEKKKPVEKTMVLGGLTMVTVYKRLHGSCLY